MEIILTEKINNLGKLGDVVKVKSGYARNYLLPQGKAIRASKENLENFEKEKSKRQEENNHNIEKANKLGKSIEGLSITVLRPASETGQLYGSVTTRDIAKLLKDKEVSINHKQVILEKTIKEIGIQGINLAIHPEVYVKIKLNVARTHEEAIIQEQTGEAVIENKEEDVVNDLNLDSEIKIDIDDKDLDTEEEVTNTK